MQSRKSFRKGGVLMNINNIFVIIGSIIFAMFAFNGLYLHIIGEISVYEVMAMTAFGYIAIDVLSDTKFEEETNKNHAIIEGETVEL